MFGIEYPDLTGRIIVFGQRTQPVGLGCGISAPLALLCGEGTPVNEPWRLIPEPLTLAYDGSPYLWTT